MQPLQIKYTLSGKVRFLALIAGGYLLLLSLFIGIREAIDKNFQFVFYLAVAGIIIATLLLLLVTVWQRQTTIEVDNEELRMKLPKQEIDGVISWDNISEVGIGLSYITLIADNDEDGESENYKIDLGNLKYNDLRDFKSKIIEVCESRQIDFKNI